MDDALIALKRLSVQCPSYSAQDELDILVATNAEEKANKPKDSSGMSYVDCFRGVDLRRIEISCFVWAFQTICGTVFMVFATFFFKQAGMSTENSFTLTLAMDGMGLIGGLCAMFFMTRAGRST